MATDIRSDRSDLSSEQAQTEIGKIPLDGALLDALRDPAHVAHKSAAAYRRSLYAAAYPETENAPATDLPDAGEEDLAAADKVDNNEAFFLPPASPADYRFDVTPDGVDHDSDLESKARQWFHQAQMPQWLAQNIVGEWNHRALQPPSSEDVAYQAAATERSLRRAWGEHYEDKIATARAFLDGMGSEEIWVLLDRSGLANSEYLIRQLVAVAEQRR